MNNYINNYYNYKDSIVYDFKLGNGGIGDYVKFFMIILMDCIKYKKRLYHKINNIEIEKYIKFRYNFFNINTDEISMLNNYVIKTPRDYHGNDKYRGDILLKEVFYFTDDIKLNVKHIITSKLDNYVSIHLRMGDKFLETDKKFVRCHWDTRSFSEDKIYNFIETNTDKTILFFCDNNEKKNRIKKKYKNIIITNAEIGHTSLSNTTSRQILDAVTEFYILSNSEFIYSASRSGFSKLASKFNGIKLITT